MKARLCAPQTKQHIRFDPVICSSPAVTPQQTSAEAVLQDQRGGNDAVTLPPEARDDFPFFSN